MNTVPVVKTQPTRAQRVVKFFKQVQTMLKEAWTEKSDISIGLLLIAAVWVIYMIVVPVITWVFTKLWELEITMWNNMGITIIVAVTIVVLIWRYFRKPTSVEKND